VRIQKDMVKTCWVISDLLGLGWNFGGNLDSGQDHPERQSMWGVSVEGEKDSLFYVKMRSKISRQNTKSGGRNGATEWTSWLISK